MFYSRELLANRGLLATIWLAGTLKRSGRFKGLFGKRVVLDANLPKLCKTITTPTAPMSLRLRASLLFGLVVVYARKTDHLLSDIEDTFTRLQQQFHRRANGDHHDGIDLPPPHHDDIIMGATHRHHLSSSSYPFSAFTIGGERHVDTLYRETALRQWCDEPTLLSVEPASAVRGGGEGDGDSGSGSGADDDPLLPLAQHDDHHPSVATFPPSVFQLPPSFSLPYYTVRLPNPAPIPAFPPNSSSSPSSSVSSHPPSPTSSDINHESQLVGVAWDEVGSVLPEVMAGDGLLLPGSSPISSPTLSSRHRHARDAMAVVTNSESGDDDEGERQERGGRHSSRKLRRRSVLDELWSPEMRNLPVMDWVGSDVGVGVDVDVGKIEAERAANRRASHYTAPHADGLDQSDYYYDADTNVHAGGDDGGDYDVGPIDDPLESEIRLLLADPTASSGNGGDSDNVAEGDDGDANRNATRRMSEASAAFSFSTIEPTTQITLDEMRIRIERDTSTLSHHRITDCSHSHILTFRDRGNRLSAATLQNGDDDGTGLEGSFRLVMPRGWSSSLPFVTPTFWAQQFQQQQRAAGNASDSTMRNGIGRGAGDDELNSGLDELVAIGGNDGFDMNQEIDVALMSAADMHMLQNAQMESVERVEENEGDGGGGDNGDGDDKMPDIPEVVIDDGDSIVEFRRHHRPSSLRTPSTSPLDKRSSRVLACLQQTAATTPTTAEGGVGDHEQEDEDETSPVVSFSDVSEGASAGAAARTFFQLLVLASLDHVTVTQTAPFADIKITIRKTINSTSTATSTAAAAVPTSERGDDEDEEEEEGEEEEERR